MHWDNGTANGNYYLGFGVMWVRRTPPFIVTVRDKKGHSRVLSYSYYGWGVLLKYGMYYMVISSNMGTPIYIRNTIILILGTPQR